MEHFDYDWRSGAAAIPLTVLTGFLGAGKTTLLNRILNGDHGLKVAALVNDFGSINIDAELVVNVQSDVISLANGCVCCAIRDDLVKTVTAMIERLEKPEYIVLEASGVAEPSGIAATFLHPGLRDRIRLDSITCVVDAEQVFAAPELERLKLWQIAFADMVLLNKVDLVDREQLSRIRSWLDDHLHRYRLVETSHCDVPLEVLLAAGRFDWTHLDARPPALEHDPHHAAICAHENHPARNHAQAFGTWSYETDRPLSLEALRQAASRLPAGIYRAKGVIHSADEPARRTVLQVVGKRVELSLADEWGARAPRTRVVAVGAAGVLAGDGLRERLDGCLASMPPAS